MADYFDSLDVALDVAIRTDVQLVIAVWQKTAARGSSF